MVKIDKWFRFDFESFLVFWHNIFLDIGIFYLRLRCISVYPFHFHSY